MINQIQHHFAEFFPDAPLRELRESLKAAFREYDFVLIGLKIGIIVIEVKSSPRKDHYYTAIKQLKSADLLLRLLEECTGIKAPDGTKVKKIVFAPHMETSSFSDQSITLSTDNGVTHWFKEDLLNLLLLL